MAKAKEIVGIECTGPAVEAVPLVLGPRLEEMCLLRNRALDFSDPEGVHDMRVASRRVRSALRDFTPYLTKTRLSASTRQLKEIADKLGVVRDYDVAIIALEKLQTKASPKTSPELQRLIDAQKAQRDPARKDLVRALKYKTMVQLQPSILQAIAASALPHASKKQAPPRTTHKSGTSYKAFARSTLLKRIKELEGLSPSLFEPQRAQPLHEMRIAAKRLRYALDLFAQCWGEPLSVFSLEVAKLQSSLGELHDCDLWIEHFGKRLSRGKKKAEPATTEDERGAMIWLLSQFTRLRTKHFRAALARWHEWEARDFCNRLSAILRT